ncbi:MAG TPA: ATP-binding protein [Thermoanaerobaculia bacterium]|nr:ATP-binding protein [Thermoanaerobaculia bacterium]
MVSGSSASLTKISFRRDVRLFFGSWAGFLAILLLFLLVLLQSFLARTRDVTQENWSNIARVSIDEIERSNLLADTGSLEASLTMLETRYGIAGITVMRPGSQVQVGVPPTQDGVQSLIRRTQGITLIFVFDASMLNTMTRTYWATAAICILATLIASVLLIFYLPRITKPVEQMLDEAAQLEEREPGRDEQQYLLETFRKSISTLRAQEAELKRMHDAQKERADDLERVTAALTRSLTSGFLAIDPRGRVVEINTAGREILHPPAEASGMTVEEAFGQSAFSEDILSAVEQRVALTRVELQMGKTIVGLSTVPLVSERQQFLGMLALFTDLTHIRDLETRIREMQTLADLGEISAGIAHEFRNSLAAILGYLRLVRMEPLGEKPRASVERAEREASQLSSAVDSLLTFARPMTLNRTQVDLLDLVSEVVRKIDAPAEVRIECGGEHAAIHADAALLSRAVENLVRNAVDSVREKGSGTVRVSVSASPRPLVRVEDDGVGLDPADVPRLLLPFQSQKPSGYGLGLPLTRKIAVLHGGSLELTGGPGRGAAATIEFYAAEPAPVLQFVTNEAQ